MAQRMEMHMHKAHGRGKRVLGSEGTWHGQHGVGVHVALIAAHARGLQTFSGELPVPSGPGPAAIRLACSMCARVRGEST